MKTDAVSGWTTIDGARIHYLAAGEAGPPVVLLHGGGLDSASLTYRYTIGPVSQSHRVFAPDLPGYGESDNPGVEFSMEYYLGFLGRFMDALGIEEAALGGISMGGGIVLGFALDNPERVEKLVLIDSYGLGGEVPGGFLSYLFVTLPLLVESSWWTLARSRWMTKQSLEAIFHDNRMVTDDLVDEVYDLLRRPGAGEAFGSFQRNEVGPSGLRTDYSQRLHELAMPTMIVHGAHDNLVPVEWARRANRLIANSQLHVLETGHWPPREKPDEFNRVLLQFLAGGETSDAT